MKKLTKKFGDKVELPLIPMEINSKEDLENFHDVRRDIETKIIRLAEYEDTGLSPEEIQALSENIKLDTHKVSIPDGYAEIERTFCIDKFKQLGIELESVTGVYIGKGEMIITGYPDEDDELHNCDEMGCSSVSHVLYRQNI